jgi:hypothetical protein
MKSYQIVKLVLLLSLIFPDCRKDNSSLVQPPTITDPNLLAYYSFSGTTLDISGNENHGVGWGIQYTTDRFGHAKSAGELDGNVIVYIPELFPDSCLEFSFAAWVRKYSTDNRNHMVLYKGSNRGEAAMNITNGNVGFGVNLGTPSSPQNWYSAIVADYLRPNIDYFLVGRYIKGQKVDFLINGKLVSSVAVPSGKLWSEASGSYSAIGTHGAPSFWQTYYWNGVIDDVRIYSKSLSDEQVQALYHEGGWTGS